MQIPVALLGLATFAPLAMAQTELYRQNPFNQTSGYASQDMNIHGGCPIYYEMGDNFPGQNAWTIGRVHWWGGYNSPANNPGVTEGFVIRFYDDNAGQPGNELYEQTVTSWNETIFHTAVVIPPDPWVGYEFSVDLPVPFDVPADGQYWLSIVANRALCGTSYQQYGWIQSPNVNAPFAWQKFSAGGPWQLTMNADDVSFVLVELPSGCDPDLTTGAVPGQPGYGVPNGVLNNDDFFYFLAQFAAGNLAVADVTTGAVAGQPGYGVPNGVINNDDFFYYLAIFAAGC